MTTDLQDAPAGAPVVEYDHQGADYAARHAEIARHLQEDAPVAWSEAHGGFWVVTRYADCKAVVGDWQGFSSENRGPGDTMRRGVLIPQIQVPLLLNECDPPLHTRRRMIEAPFFAPKHLRNWIVAAGDYTRQALDAVIESGEIDFIDDLALRVPAMTTLHVAGVDPAGWRLYAQPESFYGPGGTERAYAEIRARLVALIEQRRAAPQGDMASALARHEPAVQRARLA